MCVHADKCVSVCVHVQGRQKNEKQATAPGGFVRDCLAFREKVVKVSGKRVKTRHVSVNSMKTRGEKAKAAGWQRELVLIQGRGNAGEGASQPREQN